jgi:hypothetical protein
MKWLCLVAALFLFAGCGDVNWFPDSTTAPPSGGTTGNAAGPSAFQFAPKTATISDAGGSILSDPVTITGDNANGWKISLADSPTTIKSNLFIDTEYVITELNPNPVIKPGQKLIIDQNVPTTVKKGDKLSTVVTIGNTTAEFVTTIQ